MKVPYKSCSICAFGYCARNRCYCGHKECNAFGSWVDVSEQANQRVKIRKQSQHAESWEKRGEATWLDKL